MKISVVCLASRNGGGLTILKDLLSFARSDLDANQWQFLLSDQEVGEETHDVSIVHLSRPYKGLRSRFWAEATSGRRAVKNFKPDVVLSLQNNDTLARGRVPLALYVHQALPFQKDYKLSILNPSERKMAWRQYLLKYPIIFSIRRAQVTFVQTEWLADSILERCPRSKVHSIGFNSPSKKNELAPLREPTVRFFYPAAASPYKNHQLLHQALRQLGEEGFDLSNKMVLTLEEEKLRNLVPTLTADELRWYRFEGWLSAEEVQREYQKSILVFPSAVESLGLPLYEARETGAIIVAPDLPYAREALKDYSGVIWFTPANPTSLSKALKQSWLISQNEHVSFNSNMKSVDSWEKMLFFLSGQ